MKKIISTALVLIVSGAVLAGCAQSSADIGPEPDPNSNPAAGIILEGADMEKNINLEDVRAIKLFDLDGNAIDREFSQEEVSDIVKAFNDSVMDDSSYIQMIAGKTMVITLNDNSEIRIISYGEETRIVATVNDMTYHLISPEIGKLLLEE